MGEISGRTFWLIIATILCLQALAGLWHIGDPFIDGRYHYNWNPPFWLEHARAINEEGFRATHWGLKNYPSHPQLIALVVAPWTSLFGYGEASIRFLALSLSILGTLFLSLAIREFLGARRALAFAAIFAALPVIYIYGKMMNHEVLLTVFLGVHLLGIGMYGNRKKSGLALVALGSLGMMLSDWSGAVFALMTALGALCAWGWKEKKRVLFFCLVSFGAAGLGLLLYLLQSYAQLGSSSISDFIQNYIGLWQYRAGLESETFTWVGWLVKQHTYLFINFATVLALAGTAGLLLELPKKAVDGDAGRASIFGIAILLGTVLYLLLIRQASFIHVYYQHFLAVPFALGLVLLLDFISKKIPRLQKWWLLSVLLLVVIAGSASVYQYHKLLSEDSWGDRSDIELIMLIKKIPAEDTVITVNTDPQALLWFKNPNIVYYAGREIPGETLGNDVPHAKFVILPNGVMPAYVAVIDASPEFGANVLVQAQCSKNLCLTQLVTKNGRSVF